MKTSWLMAALLSLVTSPALAQQSQEDEDARRAEQAALAQLASQAQAPAADLEAEDPAPVPDSQEEEEGRPEDLRIVATQEPLPEDRLPATTEMNLSGSEVGVNVIGSDSVVITANEHDLAILKELLKRLDQKTPNRELRIVTLKEQAASEVASTLEKAVAQLYPRIKDRPDESVSITAVSSNILLIVAPGPKVDQVVAIAQTIDTAEVEIKADMMVFTLQNRKASEAAIKLEEIIGDLRRQQGADASEEFKITPNDANNTLMVFGPVKEEKTIRMILEQIDAEAVEGFGTLKLVVFPLVNANAKDLADMFEDMLEASESREGVEEQIRRLIMVKQGADGTMAELPPLNLEKTMRMIPHEDTNSVLVATVEENIGPMGEVIALLDDVPLSVDMGVRVFPLRFADAETVSQMLEDMFDEGKKLPDPAEGGTDIDGAVPPTPEGQALVYEVSIVPDTRTNTVYAAGRPFQLALIDQLVGEMDQPAMGLKFPLRLMFLGENIDATRVSQILETLWEQRIEALEAQDAGKAAVERERIFLAVDLRSNALILSASEQNYDEIQQICNKLDTAPDRLIDQIRIINCENTSAADLQGKIEELWERKADLRQEGEFNEDLPVIVADQRSNALVIASSPEDYEEIKRLIDRLEAQPLAPIAAIRMVELQNNDASEIADMLEQIFEERMEQRLAPGQEENPSDRVALAFDAPTNTILIASSHENYEEMIRIIEALDVEPDTEGVLQTFILENADATTVAEKIEELFDQGLYSPATGLDSQLTEERMKIAIVSDARANAVIVSASKPNLSIIRRLIDQMDSPDARENTELFALQFADAVKLTDMLERLFEGMKQNSPDSDAFNEPTIIPDDRSNLLIVSGTRDALTRCADLIERLDREPGQPTSVFEIYTLQYTSAVRLVPIMQDMFEKREEGLSDERTPINLFADEGSNALICSAARDDQAVVQHLLAILDKPSTIARQFQIFPLSMAKAQPVADTLDELFQSRAESAGSDARVDAIAVQPDERTNSLIVWASPTEMLNIETIIDRLDTAEPSREMAVRIVQLKQARAEDLAQVLEDTLIGESGGEGEDSQAVIVTYMGLNEDGSREERKLVRQDLIITPEERTNTLTVMAPADSIDMLEALIVDFDKIRPILAEVRLFPLVNADAEEVVERLEDLFEEESSGDGVEQTLTFGDGGSVTVGGGGEGSVRQQMRFAADRRTNTVMVAGSEVDLHMVEQLIYTLDAYDSEERVFLTYQVRNTTAEALTQAIRDFAQEEQDRLGDLDDETAIMRQAERHVTAIGDEQSNSVVLGVSRRYYDQYMSMIHELDRQPPQVMIQVLMAEVTLDDSVELGIEFAQQDLLFTENAVIGPNETVQGHDFDFVGGTDLGAATGSAGGFSFSITGEDFSFLLRALQTDSKLEVLSRPTLLVENNEEAKITIGDRVPIVQGSTFTDAGNTSTQVQYEDVGIILEVVPHINPDGYVNLEVHPEISQISDSSVQLTEGLNATVFSERSAETVVTVKDGETVVIGGLITENERDTESKVPFFGDIPGLGVLFRSTRHQVRKTELLMVLTVNVLRNEDDLRSISVEQRDKSGLLDDISRNPLMEGLRIRAEDFELSPSDEAPQPQPGIERRPDLYGPTPDVYGPPTVPPARVERAGHAGTPVALHQTKYGPPIPTAAPGPARTRTSVPLRVSGSGDPPPIGVNLASMTPQMP